MKLTNEERNILLQASKIIGRICSKTSNRCYAQNNCGLYENFELDEASNLCELLSRYSEINFVTEFDTDSCK